MLFKHNLATELGLALRLVFRLALRQAEAFSRGILRVLGLARPSLTTRR